MVARVGLDVDVRAKVAELNASQRTGVAIARALRIDEQAPERVLVLDEPTATLPADEVSELLQTVRAAAAEGVAVLFVTHHLEEIFLLGDTVTILRDGSAVHAGRIAAIDPRRAGGAPDGERGPAAAGGRRTAGRRAAASRLALEHLVRPGVP